MKSGCANGQIHHDHESRDPLFEQDHPSIAVVVISLQAWHGPIDIHCHYPSGASLRSHREQRTREISDGI